MSQINFDITLYNSPLYYDLIGELYRISQYKRKIYQNIRNADQYRSLLSWEERAILDDLSEKENKIILEILTNKQWLGLPNSCIEVLSKQLDNKYDPD
jgi:hypothetical protein